MSLTSPHRHELIGMTGGALLAVGVFVAWYRTDADNPNSMIDGTRGSFSAFDVHLILRWLLLAAALAPFILAYIIARRHELSWARGEMTVVTSIAAFGLVSYSGLIDRPGTIAVSLAPGWALALTGTMLMIAAAAIRSSESERPRKPPGMI